jgi:hypothetical protein
MKQLILIALSIFFAPQFLSAQTPFSSLKITLSGNHIFQGDGITESWNPTPAASLDIRTPYFKGELETGVRYLRFNEKDFDESGFQSTFIFAGWSNPISVSNTLTFSPGFRIGVTYLYQDYEKDYSGYRFDRDESEFSWELQLRTEYSIGPDWNLHITTAYNRTLLHFPMNLWYVSGGITHRLQSPQWLKSLLK